MENEILKDPKSLNLGVILAEAVEAKHEEKRDELYRKIKYLLDKLESHNFAIRESENRTAKLKEKRGKLIEKIRQVEAENFSVLDNIDVTAREGIEQ